METQNNCGAIINEQAETKLSTVGRVLSKTGQHMSEMDTAVRHHHQLSDHLYTERKTEV